MEKGRAELRTRGKNASLIITPLRNKEKGVKLPMVFKKNKRNRSIPPEFRINDFRDKIYKFAKTPVPFKKKLFDYRISKEFLNYAFEKVQHKPDVKHLEEFYRGKWNTETGKRFSDYGKRFYSNEVALSERITGNTLKADGVRDYKFSLLGLGLKESV
jgi:hypothetical protein